MATRSTIAILHSNGTLTQVYCHWDGYINGVGKTLLEHYNTLELAEELVNMGDISSLGINIADCEFYCRDRGEVFNNTLFATFDEFLTRRDQQEYNYIQR